MKMLEIEIEIKRPQSNEEKKEKAELRKGSKIEREHKMTYNFIKKYYKKYKKMPTFAKVSEHIAIDHLKENPRYYSKYKTKNKGKEFLVNYPKRKVYKKKKTSKK
jgi:hypothetical protein